MTLNRDQILSASDLKTEIVNVPEWGGDVFVRAMDARQRDQMMTMVDAKGATVPDSELKAFLCVQCVVDAEGLRLFRDDDVSALQAKSPTALDRIGDVVLIASGMRQGAAEDAVKN